MGQHWNPECVCWAGLAAPRLHGGQRLSEILCRSSVTATFAHVRDGGGVHFAVVLAHVTRNPMSEDFASPTWRRKKLLRSSKQGCAETFQLPNVHQVGNPKNMWRP